VRNAVDCTPPIDPYYIYPADTVVLTHHPPPVSNTSASLVESPEPDLLEKPESKQDNMRMLLDLNGRSCEVVTGVSVVYPILTAPGYGIKQANPFLPHCIEFANLRDIDTMV